MKYFGRDGIKVKMVVNYEPSVVGVLLINKLNLGWWVESGFIPKYRLWCTRFGGYCCTD